MVEGFLLPTDGHSTDWRRPCPIRCFLFPFLFCFEKKIHTHKYPEHSFTCLLQGRFLPLSNYAIFGQFYSYLWPEGAGETLSKMAGSVNFKLQQNGELQLYNHYLSCWDTSGRRREVNYTDSRIKVRLHISSIYLSSLKFTLIAKRHVVSTRCHIF